MNLVRTPLALFLVLLPRLAGASPHAPGEAKAKASPTVVKDPSLVGTTQASARPSPFASPTPEQARYNSLSSLDDGFPVMATLGFSSNDLQLGLGVRAGKTLTNHIYVGGAFVYHLGHEVGGAQGGGYTATASISAFYIGPEVGYDFNLSPVRVRVYTGLGIVWINTSTQTGGPGLPTVEGHASTDRFVIWPGATVLYPLPDSSFFIGGDLRFVTVPDGPAVGLFGLAGTKF
jgi:hypothetical protein